jgi:hypothetical protein
MMSASVASSAVLTISAAVGARGLVYLRGGDADIECDAVNERHTARGQQSFHVAETAAEKLKSA